MKNIVSISIVNNQVFNALRAELEQKYAGQWIIIANGRFLGAADAPKKLNHLAPTAKHRIITRMGETRPQKVELGWQMMLLES